MGTASIRPATRADLPAIVAIYNESIPGRMATADTEPVTVAAREPWFAGFDPRRRPIWVAQAPVAEHAGAGAAAPATAVAGGPVADEAQRVVGWAGLRSFYGRPAYAGTVELAVYVAADARRRGVAATLLDHAIAAAPGCGIRTLLGFVFAHNAPSLALLERRGFARWGRLPRVAELDGEERDLVILGLRVSA